VIAAVAPSSRWRPDRLAEGLALAKDAGLEIREVGTDAPPHRYFAATDANRLRSLAHALTAPEFDAVWAVRGGFGVTRMIEQIPWSALDGRTLMGFSDLTPLLHAYWRRVGGRAIHGPVLHSLSITDPGDRAQAFEMVRADMDQDWSGDTVQAGDAQGPLIGGNLCMLATSCGTPYQVNARGCILALEEVGEPLYRVDRSLQQLKASGALDGVRAVTLGEFSGLLKGEAEHLGRVVKEHLPSTPILQGLPFGHGSRNRAWRIGAEATLQGSTLRIAGAGAEPLTG